MPGPGPVPVLGAVPVPAAAPALNAGLDSVGALRLGPMARVIV